MLRECRSKTGPRIPWRAQHEVVGSVFVDGFGHSLAMFLRHLHIALMYGCRCTLPSRRCARAARARARVARE